MTDITDEDRRSARVWATIMDKCRVGNQNASAAARVILATVEAPPLSEDLAHVTEHWETWPTEAITSVLTAATALAKQMEHDLAEAHAEVERLAAQNEELRRTENYEEFREQFLTVQKGAESNAESLDPADVNETPQRTDNFREFRERLAAGQKGAESNAESLDPADVKPGEAWLVEVDGERRTAVKDRGAGVPWNTVAADGLFFTEGNENITLVTRLVPAPRVIADPDDLEQLTEGAIIRSRDGEACRKSDGGDWSVDGLDGAVGYGPRQVLPVTVLWEPEVEATESH